MSEYYQGQGFGQPGHNQLPQYGAPGHNPNLGWGGPPTQAEYGGGYNYAPSQPWTGGTHDQAPGWAGTPGPNAYSAPPQYGGNAGWDTFPAPDAGNRYAAPQVPETAPQKESLFTRAKRMLGGSASYGAVDAAPGVAPSRWGGTDYGPSAGNQYPAPASAGDWNTSPQTTGWEQTGGGFGAAVPNTTPVVSGGWRDRLPARATAGLERGREFMATPAGQMVGNVATAAVTAGANEFLGNYGAQITSEGWQVNKGQLARGVAKTAFAPHSVGRVVNQGRKAAKAAQAAGRDAATQQARDAVRNVW